MVPPTAILSTSPLILPAKSLSVAVSAVLLSVFEAVKIHLFPGDVKGTTVPWSLDNRQPVLLHAATSSFSRKGCVTQVMQGAVK